jgi:hypothetical protein
MTTTRRTATLADHTDIDLAGPGCPPAPVGSRDVVIIIAGFDLHPAGTSLAFDKGTGSLILASSELNFWSEARCRRDPGIDPHSDNLFG